MRANLSTMSNKLAVLFVSILLIAFLAGPAFSLDKLRVSHQPSKHALPSIMAIEKGWFKELGLDVSFHYFAAGMSQVEAGIAGEWDVGAMGSPPALFGGVKFGLETIGASITQELIEWLLIKKNDQEAFKANPKQWLKGKTILTTTISTGHYQLLGNLKKWGLSEKEVKIVHMGPEAILSAFVAGEGDVYQAWAPFCYLLESKGAVKIADGSTAGITIPGALVATPKFGKEHPDLVAKWLQGYLRGVLYEYQYPGEAAKYLQAYYNKLGLNISYSSCLEEMRSEPKFAIYDQLRLMDRHDGQKSKLDQYMLDLAEFFMAQGSLDKAPDVTKFITDKYMKIAAENMEKTSLVDAEFKVFGVK
jgi:ABC-type nitrate/sulfonate/bicarbonate transport system substrate-binding protein